MLGTVLALGGGGFSMSDDGTSAIDDYLLGLTGKDRPRVCFVPTASGDAEGYARRFEAAFAGRAETSVLSLFCRDPWGYTDPAALLEQDVVYVGGGSTANLLALWRLHGLPAVLAEAAARGTILAGISAGMNCWFESSSTDSFGPLAPLPDGLGFLPGSACPHYLGEQGRREKYLGWVADGTLADGYAVDEYAAVLFRDGVLVEAVAERPGQPVFRVERGSAGRAVEVEVPVRLLPAPGAATAGSVGPAGSGGRVVLMCGPAGSGKSTYARRLEAEGYARLSIDEAAWVAGHREQPLPEPVRLAFEQEVQRRLLSLVADGCDVVVDLSFWSRAMRDTYRALLAPAGVVPETVYVATPRDVVLQRVAARDGAAANDVRLDAATAARYFDHFEPPTPQEGPLTVVDGTNPA